MATNKELEKKLNDLEVLVKQFLEQKVDKPVPSPVKEERVLPTDNELLDSFLGSPSAPIPTDYREAVDTLLNKSFGIHVLYDQGIKFTIVVPAKYSKLNNAQREMNKFDLRTRVIDNSEGINGIRQWCETVFNNFDSSYQAMIVTDRNL